MWVDAVRAFDVCGTRIFLTRSGMYVYILCILDQAQYVSVTREKSQKLYTKRQLPPPGRVECNFSPQKYAKCSLFFYWQKLWSMRRQPQNLTGARDPQGVSGIAALFQPSRPVEADGVFVEASHNKEGRYL